MGGVWPRKGCGRRGVVAGGVWPRERCGHVRGVAVAGVWPWQQEARQGGTGACQRDMEGLST